MFAGCNPSVHTINRKSFGFVFKTPTIQFLGFSYSSEYFSLKVFLSITNSPCKILSFILFSL